MNLILEFEKFENEKNPDRTSKAFYFHKVSILTLSLRQSKLKLESSKARRSISALLLFEELFQFMSRIVVIES